MVLTHPDFKLDQPNPYSHVTDAEWWLWLRLHELEPKSLLGGIYANKPGFHNTGNNNEEHYPGNYSILIDRNRRGPWWRNYASALDWTFSDAQKGDYKTINKYSKRLDAACRDPNDPRPDLILYEWYGNTDTDRQVEGYDEYHEKSATSDTSHLWHIHASFFRDACGDFWAMWALLTILMGWSVRQWLDSLPEDIRVKYEPKSPAPAPAPKPVPSGDWVVNIAMSLPVLRRGSGDRHNVRKLQGLLLGHNSALGNNFVDGIFGPKTEDAVKRFQRAYGLTQDGIVGKNTWSYLFVK